MRFNNASRSHDLTELDVSVSDRGHSVSDAIPGRSENESNDPSTAQDSNHGAHELWSEIDTGLFSPFLAFGPKLPSGTYRCVLHHSRGLCLRLLEPRNDEVIQLPDDISEDLLAETEQFWGSAERFKMRGFLHKRGFLLMGPAGSGKTSVINRLSEYVLRILGGLVLLVTDPNWDEMELARLRVVEPDRPLLVAIEDIDAHLADGGEEGLLSLLDGKTQIDHVLYVATTNYPERLDPRIYARPSRFDRVHVISPPSVSARRAYLKRRAPELSDAELEEWVDLSDGFSIAHLKEMVLAAICLGADPKVTVERLRTYLDSKPSSDQFSGSRVGFMTSRRKFGRVADPQSH